MIVEGIFKSNVGWSPDVLRKLLAFDGVLRVDGKGLKADGTFTFAHVFFASEEVASGYLKALSDAAGAPVQRLV